MLGFFSGLIPRVLGDILSVLLAGGLTYAINRYLVEEKELKVYTAATMNVNQFSSISLSSNKSGLMIFSLFPLP